MISFLYFHFKLNFSRPFRSSRGTCYGSSVRLSVRHTRVLCRKTVNMSSDFSVAPSTCRIHCSCQMFRRNSSGKFNNSYRIEPALARKQLPSRRLCAWAVTVIVVSEMRDRLVVTIICCHVSPAVISRTGRRRTESCLLL